MNTDILDQVLNMLRLQASNIYTLSLCQPWSIELYAADSSSFHVVERGECWLLFPDSTTPIHVQAGDLITITNRPSYALASSPTIAAQPIRQFLQGYHQSPPPAEPENILICSTFQPKHQRTYPLLGLLPPLIHIRGESGRAVDWLQASLHFIFAERSTMKPGYEGIISRLLDVIIIMVIRYWIETYPTDEGGWLSALYHPQLGPVLELIHSQPDKDWTVEALADAAHLSRSHLAAQFTNIVGESPIRYLTRWRIQLAVMLLLEHPDMKLQAIAQRLGYQSGYAFSKAFKRVVGISPTAYRNQP